MQDIGIEQLKQNNWIEYTDNNLAFLNNRTSFFSFLNRETVKINFILCVVCLEGSFQITIDNTIRMVSQQQALVCPVNSIICNYLSSSKFCVFIACIKPSFLEELYLNKERWKYYQFVLNNHVIDFFSEDWKHFTYYHELMLDNLANTDNVLRRLIMRSLWKCFVYEFVRMIEQRIDKASSIVNKTINGEILNSKFMEMLTMSEGRIHTVQEFASRLFVTPKHLSVTIKRITGKSALKWIHESVSKEIEKKLLYSEYSIKEVANELNFPNASFFCKFVKIHLGNTPENIRNLNRKKL